MRSKIRMPASSSPSPIRVPDVGRHPSRIRKCTIVLFMLLPFVAILSCTSLDRQLQAEIGAMADTIENHLDPALPASFQAAAKGQARETVKYAETNDPLLRRNIKEMVDTIRHDLDPALPDAERARLLDHAQAVQAWADADERPAYFDRPDGEAESGNSP